MSGIINNTARQFNLKCVGKSGASRVVVRLAPGFNVVSDEHWSEFVRTGHVDPYVKELKEKKLIDFGKSIDDLLLERDPDTKSKSKSEPLPKKNPKLNED